MKLQDICSAPILERREIVGTVAIRNTVEAEVKKLRADKVVQGAINDHVAKPPINLASSGKACIFDHPDSGAQLPGIMFANDPAGNQDTKYDLSDAALDAANKAMSTTNFMLYKFKNANIVLGPKS